MSGPFTDLEAKRRIEKIESAEGAEQLGYTPADGADWPGADPTTVGGALDKNAERLAEIEGAEGAAGVGFTVDVDGDWPDPNPSDVDAALNGLAARAKSLEDVAERFAARYIVGPAGQTGVTHNTLQAAITAAEAGVRPALIYVRAGTYTEDIALGADGVHIVGEAAYEGVTIVGAHTIDIGDQPGDAATSHQAELRSLLLVAADPATGAVLTISGNPQRVWLRDVRVWGGTSAEDCLVLNCSGGQVALDGCHVWHSAGGTGTPIDVQAGTVRIDGGCAVDHGTSGIAIDNVGGVVWAPGADLRVTGQVRNQALDGAAGFAAFFSGVAITCGNTEAFICDGSGLLQLGLLGSICTGVQPIATGAGGFAWTSDQAVLVGHTAPAGTLNAGGGAVDLRTVGAASILATLATYGDVVTLDRADLREVPAGGAEGEVLTKGAGAAYDWAAAAGGGGGGLIVEATRSVNSAIGANSTVGLVYDTEVIDTAGIYDPGTGVFTPASTGRYLIDTRWSLVTAYAHSIQLEKDDGGWVDAEVIEYRNTNYGVDAMAVVLLEAGSDYRLAFSSYSGAGTNLAAGATLRIVQL